jgi:hypothetical protein
MGISGSCVGSLLHVGLVAVPECSVFDLVHRMCRGDAYIPEHLGISRLYCSLLYMIAKGQSVWTAFYSKQRTGKGVR